VAKRLPKRLAEEVINRDENICQKCGKYGGQLHHVVFGGIGRRKIHKLENLITLCQDCHRLAHSSKDMREWTYQWTRNRYGRAVDKLLKDKWSG
jgi:5-methylcytosine-specific restriction endonuclease McrA